MSSQNQSARPHLLPWSCDRGVGHEEDVGRRQSAALHIPGLSEIRVILQVWRPRVNSLPSLIGAHQREDAGSPRQPAGGVWLAEGGVQREVAALPHRDTSEGHIRASLCSARQHHQPPQPHGNYGYIGLTLTSLKIKVLGWHIPEWRSVQPESLTAACSSFIFSLFHVCLTE